MPTKPRAAQPLPRGQRKREKTRRQLVAAGLRVLAEHGEAFTVTDVVAEADVSNGTFYNYFPDREALLDALTEHLVSALAAQAAIETDSDDPAQRFATASARVLAKAAADPLWGRVVLRLESLDGETQLQATRYLREDLAQGHASGRFDVGSDDATVDLVGGTLHLAIRRLVDGRAAPDHEVNVLVRLLGALGVPTRECEAIARRGVEEARQVVAQNDG